MLRPQYLACQADIQAPLLYLLVSNFLISYHLRHDEKTGIHFAEVISTSVVINQLAKGEHLKRYVTLQMNTLKLD